jgi:hypothetical protein
MPTSAIQRGTVVFDVHDPGRHGIVHKLHLKDGKFYANVKWIKGWKSHQVRVADLRRVTAATADRTEPPPPPPSIAFDPNRRARPIKYGSWDGCAIRWRSWEAWELGFDGTWHEISAADAVTKARVMTEQEYTRRFGRVPPLPIAAFDGDGTFGWRSPLV